MSTKNTTLHRVSRTQCSTKASAPETRKWEYAPIPETYNDAINAAIAFKDEARKAQAHAEAMAEALEKFVKGFYISPAGAALAAEIPVILVGVNRCDVINPRGLAVSLELIKASAARYLELNPGDCTYGVNPAGLSLPVKMISALVEDYRAHNPGLNFIKGIAAVFNREVKS